MKVTYDQVGWPILGIRATFNHPSAHTQQWTHTHREHTPGAVSSHLCWGLLPCSRAPHHGIEGGESAVNSLPPPTIPARPRLDQTSNLSIMSPTSHNQSEVTIEKHAAITTIQSHNYFFFLSLYSSSNYASVSGWLPFFFSSFSVTILITANRVSPSYRWYSRLPLTLTSLGVPVRRSILE